MNGATDPAGVSSGSFLHPEGNSTFGSTIAPRQVSPDRRFVLVGAVSMLLPFSPALASSSRLAGASKLRALETAVSGRLGAYVYDPVSRSGFGWRESERFTQASSYKMSLAAMTLAGADAGSIDPAEVLRWSGEEVLPHSPVTAARTAAGMATLDLAKAALVTSDNTAANVLLRHLGGPAKLTAFWRSLGDRTSRIDRYEPALNVTPPGTELDTTTPRAMASTVAALVDGDVLTGHSRARLRDWMIESATGRDRLRSGFPSTWISGDKTGTGGSEARRIYVDLAFGGPPARPPLIVTAYFEPQEAGSAAAARAAGVLASVGRIAADRHSWQRTGDG